MQETPFLVDVAMGSFTDYLAGLAKTGRKNHNAVRKRNADLEYAQVPCDPRLIRRFMSLWERQEKGGRRAAWGIGFGFVEMLITRGHLQCFAAFRAEAPGDPLCLHFVERHGGYVYCYPPMYDKALHSDRSIAKFMWFRLIEHALAQPDLDWLDLGGGEHGSWRDLVTAYSRDECGKGNYKWLFVPRAAKDEPQRQPAYRVRFGVFRYTRYLDTRDEGRFARAVRGKLVTWLWVHRRRRASMLWAAVRRACTRPLRREPQRA